MAEKYTPGGKKMEAPAAPHTPTSVEAMLQKLRNEVRTVSTGLTYAKDQTLRKSVSIMENHLVKNNEVFETHLKEVNEKHKNYVENKTKHYEETINNLRIQLEEKDGILDELKGRLDECRTSKMQALEELAKTRENYSERVKALEYCIAEGREKLALLHNERDRRKSEVNKIRDLEVALEDAQSEVQKLEDKITKIENDLKDKQSLIDTLESTKESLESGLKKLEKENEEQCDKLNNYMEMCKSKVESEGSVRKVLEDQLSKIQSDWEETKKQLVKERVLYEQQGAELSEVRRELGLMKVDLRIENRHNKELETKLTTKEMQLQTLNEKVAAYELANATLSSKVASFMDEIESLKTQVEGKRDELTALLAVQAELNEQKAQLEQENTALRNDVAILRMKANEKESLEKMIALKNEMIDEKVELIDQKNRRIQALQGNVEVLKEASSVLDAQLKDFENTLGNKLEALQDAEKFKELLENENRDLREQLKKCKIDLNEAKSLKAFTEKRLELTESSLKSQSQSKESEVQAIIEKLSVATARNEELSEELTVLMTRTSELEGEKFDLRKLFESAKNEKERMAKEITSLVNTVVQMKEEIIALQSAVKEALSKGEKYKGLYEGLQEKYSVLEQSKNTHELMFTTRIDQQEKLINYLQEQLNALQDKKKKKGSIFTPRRVEKEAFTPAKTATPRTGFRPPSVPVTPLCLEQEKLAVKELEVRRETLLSKLENLQKTTSSPVTNKTPTLPPPKKEECVLLKERSNTISGGPGKAHKFKEARCENTQKCMACRDPVYKGRPMSKCELCKCSFHLACAATASKTCGLPEKSAYELQKTMSSHRAEPISDELHDEIVEGWVKIRTENMEKAQKMYLRIEGNHLIVSETDCFSPRPVEAFILNEFTTVFFRIEKNTEDEIAKSNYAFAMKVNFDSDGEKSSYMYMFHRNKTQKRYWIKAIQNHARTQLVPPGDSTFGSDVSFCSVENKENGVIKVKDIVLLEDQRSNKIYVNCVYLLPNSQVYLLGCDDGLYSLKTPTDKPVKIEGPQAIYQIDALAAAKTVVFIEGPKQVLSYVYMGLLNTCAEAAECSNPKFLSQVVPQTKDCYMFATRGNSLKDTIVAAAGSNVLLLCAWSEEGLRLVKQIKVKDSITTMLMTPHTVLYGNHSVYEVDTKTFEQEPFLDSTDDAVYYVQLLNESHGSYPVAILDVTQSNGSKASDPEYLICFQDIGIFVDSFGNRSRAGDVLWSRVPISFEYRHPFLYIFHFTTVEIQKLDEKSYTRTSAENFAKSDGKSSFKSKIVMPPTRFIQMSPKTTANYVGKSKNGVVVSLSDTRITKVLEFTAIP